MYFFDLLFFIFLPCLSALSQAADDPFLPYWNLQLSSMHHGLFPLVSPSLHASTKQICQAQIFRSYSNQGQLLPLPPCPSMLAPQVLGCFAEPGYHYKLLHLQCLSQQHLSVSRIAPGLQFMKSMAGIDSSVPFLECLKRKCVPMPGVEFSELMCLGRDPEMTCLSCLIL